MNMIREYREKFKNGELRVVTAISEKAVKDGIFDGFKNRYQLNSWKNKTNQSDRELVDKRL
jgi:hypothetical protein